MEATLLVRVELDAAGKAPAEEALARLEEAIEERGLGEVEGTVSFGGAEKVLMVNLEVVRDEDVERIHFPKFQALLAELGLEAVATLDRPKEDDEDWDDEDAEADDDDDDEDDEDDDEDGKADDEEEDPGEDDDEE